MGSGCEAHVPDPKLVKFSSSDLKTAPLSASLSLCFSFSVSVSIFLSLSISLPVSPLLSLAPSTSHKQTLEQFNLTPAHSGPAPRPTLTPPANTRGHSLLATLSHTFLVTPSHPPSRSAPHLPAGCILLRPGAQTVKGLHLGGDPGPPLGQAKSSPPPLPARSQDSGRTQWWQ